jgi:predicted alpha/beta-fold hydrolase
MTLWGRFFRPAHRLPLWQERWETPDGDSVTLVRLDAPPASPRLVILHGLEGSARSHYAQGMLAEALRRGWGADVLVFRTCDGRGNVCRRTYHSGETADLDMVVRRVRGEDARRDIALFGVSLGANVVLKWLGERAEKARAAIRAAAAVSTPFDLARSSFRISQGMSRVYQRHFLRSLRGKALMKLERYPDIALPQIIRSARTLREFDDAFTAPAHGFRDADDYYTRSSSINYLASIRVPALLLSARDDPFHPPEVLSDVARLAAANPCLHTEFPERGGHAGFVEGASPFYPRYYVDRRVGDFFASQLAAGSTTPMESSLRSSYDADMPGERAPSR